MNVFRRFSVFLGAGFLLLGYNNCSRHEGFRDLNSQELALCKQELQDLYHQVYYGYLTRSNTCVSCHNETGESPLKFAAADFDLSYSEFEKAGHALLYRKAIAPDHAKGITGPRQQGPFDVMGQFWSQGLSQYESCLQGQDAATEGVLTSAKSPAALFFAGAESSVLSWNLDSAQDRRAEDPVIHMAVSANLSLTRASGVPDGFVINSLSVQLKRGVDRVVIDGIYLFVNGQLVPEFEGLAGIQKSLTGVDAVSLVGAGTSIPRVEVRGLPVLSSKDNISIYFRHLKQSDRSDAIPDPAPALLLQVPTTGGGENEFFGPNQMNATLRMKLEPNIRRVCVTSSSTRPVDATLPCPGREGVQGTERGWNLVERNNLNDFSILFSLQPSTPAVNGQRYSFRIWTGSNDLVTSSKPTEFSFTFDNQAPEAEKFASLSYTAFTGDPKGLVIDPVNGLPLVNFTLQPRPSSPNPETLTWCLKEVDYQLSTPNVVPNSANCNWTRQRPSNYGIAAAGRVRVALFVRDRVGNISPLPANGTGNNAIPLIAQKTLSSNAVSLTGAGVFEVDATQVAGLFRRFNVISGADEARRSHALALMSKANLVQAPSTWKSLSLGPKASPRVLDLTQLASFENASSGLGLRNDLRKALRRETGFEDPFSSLMTEDQRQSLLWFLRHNFASDGDNWL